MAQIRYSRWDGTQRLDDLDADELLSAMSDDLLAGADLRSALRRLFQRGAHPPQGQRLQGLQDIKPSLDQLRDKLQLHQQDLNRHRHLLQKQPPLLFLGRRDQVQHLLLQNHSARHFVHNQHMLHFLLMFHQKHR